MIPYNEESLNKLYNECFFQQKVGKNILNVPAAFDTETTSFIDEQGEKSALCYIWMFGINNTVVYSRQLSDFADMCAKLSGFLKTIGAKLIVYVHFFKFDFSFIKKVIPWEKVFLKENRDVLYATCGNLEFRDSLVLSGGQSLERIGNNLRVPVRKAKGDLDYSLIRHSKTPLTEKELHYCEMDIRVLCEYIREKIEDDGDISMIPYTNTGYVRNYVRASCFENDRAYRKFISGLTMTPDCYMQAESAFMGGSVSPNIKYVGEECANVHSYDIKSSYPYVMCTGYYPINYFVPVTENSLTGQTSLMDKYCCLMTVELWNVEPKTDYYFPISKHKCIDTVAPITDNDEVFSASGRIINALYLKINCTELDFKTWKEFYNWSDCKISHMRIAPRGMLPRPIIESVLRFFFLKTTLDGVAGMEKSYMIAKNMLNSIYGMMVEKPVRPVFGYVNDEGFTKEMADVVEQIDSYNEKFNRFLFYPWGVWVTSHARYRLHKAILGVGKDFRYCDTDSVKFVGDHYDFFYKESEEAFNSMRKLADTLRLPIERVIPRSPNGAAKILGVWEHEYDAYRFKTLGAKRYLVEYASKGSREYKPGEKYELTVAGTNKDSTLKYIMEQASLTGQTPFQVFNQDLVIPEEYAKRTVSKFIDNDKSGWITDYLGNREYFYSPSGIYVEPTTYSFSITDEIKNAINWACHEGHFVDGQI